MSESTTRAVVWSSVLVLASDYVIARSCCSEMADTFISGLTKHFGSARVLDGIDLEIGRGVTTVVGKSGTGKSVLLKCIAEIIRATGGRSNWRANRLRSAVDVRSTLE